MIRQIFDIAIVGAGPVGLFTSFQAGMLGMKSCIIDNLAFVGGQCAALYPEKPIYDIPSHSQISGAELIAKLKKQSDIFKPTYLLDQQVVSLSEDNQGFAITTSKNTLHAKVIVIAAGCGAFKPKKPELNNIESYEDKSIFYSVSSINQFADKTILIAGGGDSAADWTINLGNTAKKIYLLHRREKFRCLPHSFSQIKELEKSGIVEMVVPYQLHDIEGSDGIIDNVLVRDLKGNVKKIQCDVLLPLYGLSMELGPIRNWGLNLHTNHIEVDASYYQTNRNGIYAVGDIAHYPGKLKLILSGFAEAASAIHHSYKRVFDGKALHFQYSTTKGIKTI